MKHYLVSSSKRGCRGLKNLVRQWTNFWWSQDHQKSRKMWTRIFYNPKSSIHCICVVYATVLQNTLDARIGMNWFSSEAQMQYSKKLSIFEVSLQVAMPARRPIGQYFFEDERGRTVTVNLEQNIAMFNNFLTPAFRHLASSITPHMPLTFFVEIFQVRWLN